MIDIIDFIKFILLRAYNIFNINYNLVKKNNIKTLLRCVMVVQTPVAICCPVIANR